MKITTPFSSPTCRPTVPKCLKEGFAPEVIPPPSPSMPMRQLSPVRANVLILLLLLGARSAWGQVTVLTQHNDKSRTGANLNELILNTSNVNVNQFGQLFSRPVDGQVFAQPLYVPNVNIPGQGPRNVLYVATMNNSVYAFDADDPSVSAPYWQVNLGTAVPIQDTGCTLNIESVIGVNATPVIDLSSNTIYLVTKTKQGNNTYFQKLHALDIATGQPKPGSPAIIQAASGFDPVRHLNRAALLLLNGVIYIAFGSHCDITPYHGWVFGYNASTLQQVAAWNATPNLGMAGVWQSGQGLVADGNGYIYCMTANGPFDANVGGSAYGESFVKLATPGLNLVDYFTPYNFESLNAGDLDLGSAGPLLIPGTNRLVGGGKEGVFYLLDTNNMGNFNASSDQVLQRFQATNPPTDSPIHGSPIYWNSPNYGPLVYLWGDIDHLKAFRYINGSLQTNPVMTSTVSGGEAGAGPHAVWGSILSLSANGSTPGTGILWATRSNGGDANTITQPGILHAFDASNLSVELWNSRQNAPRDDFGNFAKFSPPTIANGKVYLATFSNQLVVYGLIGSPPPPDTTPPIISNGQPTGTLATGTTQTTLSLSTNENATCRYATTAGVPFASMPNAFSSTGGLTHSTLVTGLSNGQSYNYYLRCSDSSGNINTSDYIISFAVSTVSSSGPVAAYAFNENSGNTTADASGNSNTGTLNGASWTTQGKFGNALSFNGSSYVTVNDSNSLDLTTGMTLEAWIYPTATPSNWSTALMKEQTGDLVYALYAGSPSNRPSVYIVTSGEQGTDGPSALPLNTWSHLAGTYDGVTIRLYVNGNQVATQVASGAMVNSTRPLRIGGNAVWGEYFQGRIDEVRVYTRALTQSEIQTDSNTPVGGASSPAITGISPNSGSTAGGQSVNINGNNLSGATGVTFGGVAATITANSATLITVTTPAHAAGAVNVVVTTSGGSTTSTGGYTYLAGPAITSISPTSGPVGTSVVINGTALTGATVVKFNTTNATSFTVNNDAQITAIVPAGATSGPITVTTAGGTATSSTSFTVTGTPPTVTSITPNTMNVGTTVNVTVSGANFLTGATLTFQNGPGSAPTPSNIALVNVNTLTATVKVKPGGSKNNRVWDVVVTNSDGSSGRLVGGFVVTP